MIISFNDKSSEIRFLNEKLMESKNINISYGRSSCIDFNGSGVSVMKRTEDENVSGKIILALIYNSDDSNWYMLHWSSAQWQLITSPFFSLSSAGKRMLNFFKNISGDMVEFQYEC